MYPSNYQVPVSTGYASPAYDIASYMDSYTPSAGYAAPSYQTVVPYPVPVYPTPTYIAPAGYGGGARAGFAIVVVVVILLLILGAMWYYPRFTGNVFK